MASQGEPGVDRRCVPPTFDCPKSRNPGTVSWWGGCWCYRNQPMLAGGGVRWINLGCGDRYADGWWNVDHAGSPHRKDEAVDLRQPLPWEPASITHVYAGHVLEHLTFDEAAILLVRLLPCMVPNGQIMVVGPDVDVAQAMAEAGTLEVTMDSLRYGADRWDGDRHHWECTGPLVAGLLQAAGWVDVNDVGIGDVRDMWPVADRRPQWQCAITAYARPAETRP